MGWGGFGKGVGKDGRWVMGIGWVGKGVWCGMVRWVWGGEGWGRKVRIGVG